MSLIPWIVYESFNQKCRRGNFNFIVGYLGECQLGQWKCSSSQDCQSKEEPCEGKCSEKGWKLNCREKCDLIEKATFFKCDDHCQSVHRPCHRKCYFQDWQINCKGDCEQNQTVYDCNGNCITVDVPCSEDCNGTRHLWIKSLFKICVDELKIQIVYWNRK